MHMEFYKKKKLVKFCCAGKAKLCHILKILVDTKSSSSANIIEAFLDITSMKTSSTNITTQNDSGKLTYRHH